MLTHDYCHDFTHSIPICEEVGKIYMDHSLCSSYHIVITINITQRKFVYTVSCVAAAKVNHVIPCFSIRWKSKGSLFINHLALNLSWSLIITTLSKSIL